MLREHRNMLFAYASTKIKQAIICVSSLALFSACATYRSHPLDQSLALAPSVEQLHTKIDPSAHPELPGAWRDRSVNAEDGLDEVEVAVLAVLNSPHLRAARMQVDEAQAQLINAGLLPDPQFSASVDFPPSNHPTLVTGYRFGLGFDVQSLITHDAKKDAATEQARSTYLNVLWQEWQIIQQARMLYRRALIQQQQLEVTRNQYRLTQHAWEINKKALDQGNVSLDQGKLALTSMQNAQATWIEVRRQCNATLHDLALLLGVDPSVKLPLSPPHRGLESLLSPPPEPEAFQAMLGTTGQRRPDLLALQAGYTSQEATVREQILSQFPSLSIGANRTRDTTGIWTFGPFINLSLPLLNGNRGNIAVARATRQRLNAEYHDRLATAYVQARKLAQDQRLAFDEWKALGSDLSRRDESVKQLDDALKVGHIDMLTFTTLRKAYFVRQVQVLTLEQALLEQQVALETLTGTLLPSPFSHQGETP